MKPFLLGAGLLAGLAGCKHSDEPIPALTPVGGTWTLTEQTIAVTPTSGPSTTTSVAVAPNGTTLVFADDGSVQITLKASASLSGATMIQRGTYTLANGIVTSSILGVTLYTLKSTVLTAHTLTLVSSALPVVTGTAVETTTYTR